MSDNNLVVVRGGGDLGTGVACHLYAAGAHVVITELSHPKMVRHTVCLGYAVYSGKQMVEGVEARLVTLDVCPRRRGEFIPVVIDNDQKALNALRPAFLYDCRMLKKPLDDLRPLAPVTVGLGPGFCAGSRFDDGAKEQADANVDFAIETQRGETLAKIITCGSPVPNTGVPGVVAGESSRRLLRAPCAGIFRGVRQVGDIIEASEVVGYVDESPVISALSGRLRGLVHDGLLVSAGEKIGDCDPRGKDVSVYEISDKAHAIGNSAAMIYTRLKDI